MASGRDPSFVERLDELSRAAEGAPWSEEALNRFVQHCYAEGWVLSDFDWGDWMVTAAALSAERSLVASADQDTLAKLLTTHIRQDRFAEGHLAGVAASGLLEDIGKRAYEIARTIKLASK